MRREEPLQRIYGSVPNAFHASFVFLPPVQKKTKRPDRRLTPEPQPLLHSSSGGKPRGGHMGSSGTNGAVDRWRKWGGRGSPGTAPLLSAPTWCLAGQWSVVTQRGAQAGSLCWEAGTREPPNARRCPAQPSRLSQVSLRLHHGDAARGRMRVAVRSVRSAPLHTTPTPSCLASPAGLPQRWVDATAACRA